MLQEIKSGTVKVALMLTLAASAYTVSNVQAVEIPIPTGDTEIQQVVTAVRGDTMVKDMMNRDPRWSDHSNVRSDASD